MVLKYNLLYPVSATLYLCLLLPSPCTPWSSCLTPLSTSGVFSLLSVCSASLSAAIQEANKTKQEKTGAKELCKQQIKITLGF